MFFKSTSILLIFSCIFCVHSQEIKEEKKVISSEPLWLYSICATALVSAAPVLVILLIPDLKNHRSLLNVLLAFAAGGLLGDAFLHLIPHAVQPHGHEHSHEHGHGHSHGGGHDHTQNMIVGLWVVAGILSFLCVEKFVRLVKGDGHGHSHHHINHEISDSQGITKGEGESSTEVRKRKNNTKSGENQIDHIDSSFHSQKQDSDESDPIKVSGYLNLVADFAHNFTDGLAIGASFLVNTNVGIVTTITILFHEVPHEIGDFAILIQSGCSKKKAILLQLVTAGGAMLGTVLSLLASDLGTSHTWILPYTAGGFIYISTVSVLPELIGGTGDETGKGKTSSTLLQSVFEILALIVGVGMMVLIAYYE